MSQYVSPENTTVFVIDDNDDIVVLRAVDASTGAGKWELEHYDPQGLAGFSSDPVVGVVNGKSTVFIGRLGNCALGVASGATKWSRTLALPPRRRHWLLVGDA